MSESRVPPGEGLDVHTFLMDVGGDTDQFGSMYMPMLQRALQDTDPAILPDVLAGIVLDAPLDNESWQTYHVRAGYAERLYPSAALTAFARAATDPELASALISRLEATDAEVVLERLRPIAESVHTRMLSTPGSSIVACAQLSTWTLQQRPPQEGQQQNPFIAALRYRTASEVAIVRAIWDQAGHADLSDQIGEVLQARQAQEAQATEVTAAQETQRLAAERRRQAEQALREAEQERREQIIREPQAAIIEYAGGMGVAAVEDIEGLTVDQLEYLIFAAHIVIDRNYLDREITEPTPAYSIATAVMDRASNLQREGHKFVGLHHGYYVGEYEKRPALYASTEPKFWDELAKYAEWHEVSPSTAASLYSDWKDRYVTWQRYERASQVIDESGSTAEAFLPEDCANIEVVPYGGTVTYDNINDLLQDMRRYYVPRSERFDSFVAAYQEVITSSGIESAEAQSLLSRLNEAAGTSDEGIMNRIEQEIRDWLWSGDQEYHDSYDDRGGDPYKYMTTTFSGQGIAVKRTDGGYALSIQGRGYNYNGDNPADFIERFAILSGRDVTYDDGLSISYYANAPEEIERVTRIVRDESRDYVKVDIPLGGILRILGNTLGLQIANIDEAARAIIEADDYRGASFQLGDYAVRVRVCANDMTYDADSSRATGYQIILQRSTGGKEFALPETKTEVSVAIDLPGALQQVVKRAVSARTLIHNRPMHNRNMYRDIPKQAVA